MSKQPSLPYLYITQALHNENTNKPHDTNKMNTMLNVRNWCNFWLITLFNGSNTVICYTSVTKQQFTFHQGNFKLARQ